MKSLLFVMLICSWIHLKTAPAEKESPQSPPTFNAIVARVGGDCGATPLLIFYQEGKPVRPPVYALNFPETLKKAGLKLVVQWRQAKQEEKVRCRTLGPGYEQIYIIKAKRAE